MKTQDKLVTPKKLVVVHLVLSLIVGGVVLYIALQHNNQSEFYTQNSEGRIVQIDFIYILIIFVSWFGITFFPLQGIVWTLYFLIRGIRKRYGK